MVSDMVSLWQWMLVGMVYLSSCLWSSYEDVMRVHIEVLSAMVQKAEARAEAGRRPTPNDITELLYPLERGRQFARQYEKQAGRQSYRSFEFILDQYEQLAREIDVARVSTEDWERLRPRLAEESAVWSAAATKVLREVEREARGGT